MRKRCKNCKHRKSSHSDGTCGTYVQVGSRSIRYLCGCTDYQEEEYEI